jgi:hypothetical protein
MPTAAGAPESDRRRGTNSREDNIIQQGHQEQQQELTTRTLATAAETIATSQTSTAEGRPAIAEMPATFSRDTSKNSRNSQLAAAETIGTSQTSTSVR